MMEPRNFICFRCKHWRYFDDGCDAFPEGIPDEILQTNKHDQPLSDQENDLVFSPGDADEILNRQLDEIQD